MLQKLTLTYNDFRKINKYCKKKKIKFLSTPFDLKSIDFLKNLNMKYFKIPSGEITNLPYLIKVAKLKKKVILSTGMANLIEIKKALQRNESCEIRGFGRFSSRIQKKRISRNPRTGEKVETPEKKTIHFKMAKELFKKLNTNE